MKPFLAGGKNRTRNNNEGSDSDSIDEETLKQAVQSDSADEEQHGQKLSGIRQVMKSPISRELVQRREL